MPQVGPTIGAVLDASLAVGEIALLKGDEGLEGAGARGIGGLGDVVNGGGVAEGDELDVDVEDGGGESRQSVAERGVGHEEGLASRRV
ncbi:hypothetical protein [Streptomyces sp. NPDC002078]